MLTPEDESVLERSPLITREAFAEQRSKEDFGKFLADRARAEAAAPSEWRPPVGGGLRSRIVFGEPPEKRAAGGGDVRHSRVIVVVKPPTEQRRAPIGGDEIGRVSLLAVLGIEAVAQ